MSGDIVAPLQGVDTSSLSPLDLTTIATKIANHTEGECFVGGDGPDYVGLVAIIVFYLAVLGVRLDIKKMMMREHHIMKILLFRLESGPAGKREKRNRIKNR